MSKQHMKSTNQTTGLIESRFTDSSRGMILPTILIVMLIVMTVGLSLSAFVLAQLDRTTRGVMTANAMLAAEAGAEMTLHGLNEDQTFGGYPAEVEFTDRNIGTTTYQTRIEEGDLSNEKIITSTGRFYEPNNSSHTVQRSVQLVVVGTTTDDFSVQTGPGGLIMNNQATIANGDVHINGYLQMSNQARIGSADSPSNVYVANVNCPEPPDGTFPRQCGPGESEPINISSPAHIYGRVEANNQTNDEHMSSPGLVADTGVEAVPLPAFDRPSVGNVISDEGQNMLATEASCSQNGGEQVWQANTRIVNGDVGISRSCTAIIEGNVWIDQNLIMSNSGTIQVSDSVTEPPILMIDGSSGIEMRNSSRILTNSNGVGVRIITFYSEASCSPDCNDGEVAGQDLYDSRDIITINLRNSSLAAGTTFYARWTKARLNQSGAIGGVIGQTVELSNTGNISFGTELSSGETVWAIKNYQQVFE